MSLNYSKSISCYASDTAGVCSALFELGGMTVVHDASGCNSTYATHDEPRWYHADSMVYISALTETDAVCGNDQKLIDDVVNAALELHPAFTALCNSPIPLMTGCDMTAVAYEIEQRTGIVSFAVPTSGMKHYHQGAAAAWMRWAERFLPENAPAVKRQNRVNILGATPLDFSLNGNVESIVDFLQKNNCLVQSVWAMNSSVEELVGSPEAAVNLVVSNSGLPLARYMFERYGIPFVCAVPLGIKGSEAVKKALEQAVDTGRCLYPCSERPLNRAATATAAVIGDAVFAGSLAYCLAAESGIACRVIDPLAGDAALLNQSIDRQLADGKSIAGALQNVDWVIADPMYWPIIPAGKKVIRLPHEAFSGRCYHRERLNLIDRTIDWENIVCKK